MIPIKIEEEGKNKTGGHYQCTGYEVVVPASTGTQELTLSFPIPVSVLSAEWNNPSNASTDSIEFQVAPDTITGNITSDVAVSDNLINVSSTVIANTQVGYFIKLSDGTNTNDLGRVLSIDYDNNTITVENTATNSFLAATPTYVKQTVKMITKMYLSNGGRHQIGESKIGGSYVPANTTMKLIYDNVSGTAKTFAFIIEYLY